MSRYLTQKELEEEIANISDVEVRSDNSFDNCDSDVSETEDCTELLCDDEDIENLSEDVVGSDTVGEECDTPHVYKSKSGKTYLAHPPRSTRRAVPNIFRERPGLRNDGKVESILQSFQKFMTPEIMQILVLHTNEEAEHKNIPKTDDTEILALLGIFILMGANDDTKLDYHDLWSKKLGRSAYIATMSRNRFRQLTKILRFDDKTTRAERKQADKFAPLREIFDLLDHTFLKYFTPGMNVVIDEMLSLFRGRCPFKVFMKDKPGKYGVLIRMLADCSTRYVLRMEVYAGKPQNSTSISRGPQGIVKRLVDPIKNSGRNVTTDRYYTSVELAEDLYKDFGLTLVGTLQQNRKHIPEILKKTEGRHVHTNMFAFSDPKSGNPPVTLLSYVTREKPTKVLLFLSTQHSDDAISGENKNKSDINLFYNETKGGVDTVDQMARKYTCKRSTRRWPLSVFFTLLDIAAINAYSLFILNFPHWNENKSNRRRLFLQELGLALTIPLIERRAERLNGLQNFVLHAMENILERKLFQAVAPTQSEHGKGRCHSCCKLAKSKKEKTNKLAKTTIVCSKCQKYVCGKHSKKSNICQSCDGAANSTEEEDFE